MVTDNLNIHKEKSFYETFNEEEAKPILDKIEFHYTPKHQIDSMPQKLRSM
jgi:hypothetical protein